MTTFAGGRSRTTRARFALAIAPTLICAAFAAPAAEAGNYSARFCAEGLTTAGDKSPFERFGNETVFGLANNCGAFNGLRVRHNADNAGTEGVEAGWIAQRPDGIAVSRIDYRAAGSGQSAGYFPQVIGDKDADSQLDIIAGGAQLTGSFADYSITGDVRRFGVRLLCQTDGGACGANPANPEVKLKNVTYTVSDPAPPSLTVTGGTMFEAAVQAGSQTITFDAADTGAGVHHAIAVVNGVEAATFRTECALGDGFALTFKPCPSTLEGSVTVNTAVAPWQNGPNSVQLCVEDYSTDGTAGRTCAPAQRVRVLNGCVANSAPTNLGQTLTLEWPGKRNAAAQTRQGRARDAVVGVFGPAGVPLAGAAVCLSRSIPGSPVERLIEPGAITGADGSVAVKIRGATSRTVYATYWSGPEAVITQQLRLDVSPAIRLELRPDDEVEIGDPTRVVAKLRGRWRADRRVCFYAERPGNDRVGCDRTGDGGRARFTYKPKKPGELGFYAKVPNQKDYPYVNGRSKMKRLKVKER